MPTIRPRTTVAGLVAGAAAVVLTACGSDTSGPKALTAAQAAVHYDSLAGALLAAGTSSDTVRAAIVMFISGVTADGQAPTNVNVTMDGTKSTWYAIFFNVVDSAQQDSTEAIVYWSDLSADDAVILFFAGGAPEFAAAIAANGDGDLASTVTATGTFGTPSGSCTFTTIQNVPVTDPTYDPTGSTCQPQSVTGSLTVSAFAADTTETSSIQTFSAAPQTIAGVRLHYTTSAPFPSAVSHPLSAIRRVYSGH